MKRFAVTSVSIATGFLALAASGSVFAQSQSTQLMSGYAEISHTLDTKSASQGQVFSVKLDDSIQAPGGLKLPRGTELIGHVDQVQASHDKGEASMELTFDKARLKDGQEVPIKATVVGVNYAGAVGEVPMQVAADDTFEQQTGRSGETLHSAVQDQDSGTLVRNDRDIRLVSGTKLLIAVASASTVAATPSGS